MNRLLLSIRDGSLRLEATPPPAVPPAGLLVATRASLISSGTERSVHRLAGASLVRKARARPDLVRAVVDRARRDGLRATYRAVRSRLDEDMPVGYSAAGTVEAVGEVASGFRPGHRVVTAGVGHADLQAVPGNLAAPLPDGVSYEEGAFGAVASVALHALRLAEVGPGSRVVVIGLGLVGQLAVRLALAAGCEVAGSDIDDGKLAVARDTGAAAFPASPDGYQAVVDWTQGRGADAVLVTAATASSEPIRVAADAARDRATIVAVGDVGLDLDRRPLYAKELTLRVSRAYGPGRYDPAYEDLGVDYPIGYVRWPIARNLEAVMGLIASGRLQVADLVTHRFPFERAVAAYDVLDGDEPYLGILLEYPQTRVDRSPIPLNRPSVAARRATTSLASGLIGAGRFADGILVPAATRAGFGPWTRVASEGGASAVRLGRRHGFREAAATGSDVIEDDTTAVVFVASRHDSHAGYVAAALDAGKHVFCEKPLAITDDDLRAVAEAWARSPGVLMVGFNRRWSPAIAAAREHLADAGPFQILYRVHAGALPEGHWLHDRRQGGRLLGEACHFIDTCDALVGGPPRAVHAIATGDGELLLRDRFTLTLDYPDGSQAVVVYSSGAPRGSRKEHVEVLAGDRTVEIDDYRAVVLRTGTSARRVRYRPADKGHDAELAAFRAAIEGRLDPESLARTALATTRVALAAVDSLMSGDVVHLDGT